MTKIQLRNQLIKVLYRNKKKQQIRNSEFQLYLIFLYFVTTL
jgi:hypothetical protein